MLEGRAPGPQGPHQVPLACADKRALIMNILLAEDDTTSRDLMRRIIALEPGHVLTQARDGEEAWQILREASPRFDVGIFDVTMPRIDGIGLVERIRASAAWRTLPVILCTAMNDRHTVERARLLSVNHYIVKPYTRSLVLDKLRLVAAELATHIAVEDAATVADRLGVDQSTVAELVAGLVAEVRAWVDRARFGRQPADFEQLAVAVNGLKGAALNLGLRALGQELGLAETVLLERFAAAARTPFPPSALEIAIELESVVAQLVQIESRFNAAA